MKVGVTILILDRADFRARKIMCIPNSIKICNAKMDSTARRYRQFYYFN